MTATRHYLLAAGGTGGHMLPAYALAGELIARGHRVALVSDDRGLRIPGAPAELETHVLPAGSVHGGPVGWVKAALAIRKGRAMAIDLIRDFDPDLAGATAGDPAGDLAGPEAQADPLPPGPSPAELSLSDGGS